MYYYVKIRHWIPYSTLSYEVDYFMKDEESQECFIQRFDEFMDASLNEIVKQGTAVFNSAGVLIAN